MPRGKRFTGFALSPHRVGFGGEQCAYEHRIGSPLAVMEKSDSHPAAGDHESLPILTQRRALHADPASLLLLISVRHTPLALWLQINLLTKLL